MRWGSFEPLGLELHHILQTHAGISVHKQDPPLAKLLLPSILASASPNILRRVATECLLDLTLQQPFSVLAGIWLSLLLFFLAVLCPGASSQLFGGGGKAVELVEVDLEDPSTIAPAIGSAAKVVCSIGASEKEALNATAPYRIDKVATENLIKAGEATASFRFLRRLKKPARQSSC